MIQYAYNGIYSCSWKMGCTLYWDSRQFLSLCLGPRTYIWWTAMVFPVAPIWERYGKACLHFTPVSAQFGLKKCEFPIFLLPECGFSSWQISRHPRSNIYIWLVKMKSLLRGLCSSIRKNWKQCSWNISPLIQGYN